MAAVAKLRVTYTDGKSTEVIAGPRAQVACERHFKKSIQELGAAGSVEVLYFLAWAALHFAGQEPRDFDQFLDVLAEVEDAGAEQAGPTAVAQPLAS